MEQVEQVETMKMNKNLWGCCVTQAQRHEAPCKRRAHQPRVSVKALRTPQPLGRAKPVESLDLL